MAIPGRLAYCLSPGALPETHAAYHRLPAFFVGDMLLQELSAAQTRAIVNYVRHGGTLVMSAGTRGR